MRSPVALHLYGYCLDGINGFRQDITEQLQHTWRRSVRDVGGYWIGTADWDGSTDEMLDMFQNGMMLEIREMSGGMMTWQGFLAEMALTYKNQRYTRSWYDVANRCKVIYSLMGTNQITNNSCELTVWDAYGTPTIRELSSAWATKGSYSAHVATDAANEGVIIQSSITIAAGKNYQGRVTVNVISGTWRLEIYRSDGTIVDYADQADAGQSVITVGISEDNLVGGTVGMRLYCIDASGEAYADAAVFQSIAMRAETGWNENAQSQSEYGTIEYIESKNGLTSGAALALAAKLVYDKAWASIRPPTQAQTIQREIPDSLELTFLGYACTLRNFYTQNGGTEDEASTLITSMVGESEFVGIGSVQTNTMSYYIDDGTLQRVWDLVRDITVAGDASSNRWTCGVYADRRLYYEAAGTVSVARISNGRVLAQDYAPLEGWLAVPGLVALDDTPAVYGAGARIEDRYNTLWMNEVEFDLGDYLSGGDGILFRQVAI